MKIDFHLLINTLVYQQSTRRNCPNLKKKKKAESYKLFKKVVKNNENYYNSLQKRYTVIFCLLKTVNITNDDKCQHFSAFMVFDV